MLQTSSSLQSRLPRWRCEGKSIKTAPASNEVFLEGFAKENAYLEHGVASPMFDESDWQLTRANNLCTAGFLDINTWPTHYLSRVLVQILWGRLEWGLELIWSISTDQFINNPVDATAGSECLLFKSFKKSLVRGWSWFETFSLGDTINKACLETGDDLDHHHWQILWERLGWRLELVWSLKPCKEGLIVD